MLFTPYTLLYTRSVAQWLESLAFFGGLWVRSLEEAIPPIFDLFSREADDGAPVVSVCIL